MYNTAVETADYDAGLRKFMISVYNNMLMGLLISGLTAFFIATNPTLVALFWKTALAWVIIFLPLVLSLGLMFLIDKISPPMAQVFFYVYALAMGASLSLFFVMFKMTSIIQVFFITSAVFGTMSLYGYTTKRDLSSLNSFLMMGLFGIIIAGVINIFLQSSMMAFIISCCAVIVFTLLVAFDTQNLKEIYYNSSGEEQQKMGIIGALSLYMNFVNIFIHLLQLIGEKNE